MTDEETIRHYMHTKATHTIADKLREAKDALTHLGHTPDEIRKAVTEVCQGELQD